MTIEPDPNPWQSRAKAPPAPAIVSGLQAYVHWAIVWGQIAGYFARALGRARTDHDVAASLRQPAGDRSPELSRATDHSDSHAITPEADAASRPNPSFMSFLRH